MAHVNIHNPAVWRGLCLAAAVLCGAMPIAAPAAAAKTAQSPSSATAPAPARDAALERVEALAGDGASELALRFMNREQPDASAHPAAWVRWEYARVAIYRNRDDWAAVERRLATLPPGLPAEFQRWARRQLAEARLARGDGLGALIPLRELIWRQPAPGAAELTDLRRLVIRAYLAADRVQDAYTALLRYQQDYHDGDAAWRRLRARVMLRAGHEAEARQLLRKDRGPEARALYLLASVRGHHGDAGRVYSEARALASKKGVKPQASHQLWVVAAQAAHAAGDLDREIEALSRGLSEPVTGAPDALFHTDGDALWRAYLDLGHAQGNTQQLLLGSDPQWFAAARKLAKKKRVEARALYAVVALESRSADDRRQAHKAFIALLDRDKGVDALLSALYVDTKHYAHIEDLPSPVRLHLADQAIGRSELPLASRLIGGVTAPPKGVDPIFWQMRRARILIMGGNYDAAVAAMRELLQRHRKLPRQQIDRLMQVLFDLQSVGRHEDAIALFRALPVADQAPQLRREVLYWIADSYKALGRYDDAARLYLESATLVDAKAMDPWAQTARYQAAEALAQAGLREDARTLLQRLLAVTKNADRRAVLQKKLQQLWLRPPSTPKPAPKAAEKPAS